TAWPSRFSACLAATLEFASMLTESPSAITDAACAPAIGPAGVALVSSAGCISVLSDTPAPTVLAQAADLAPPPSPDTLVTPPPPPPMTEAAPPPFPGYAWDPGHWIWDGAQYVWEAGKYVIQPTNGATFSPGYWQQYSGGWAWVESRWS